MKPGATLLVPVLAAALRAADPTTAFSSRSEFQFYREATQSWERSPFNRVASLDDNAWSAEWLPDFTWRGDGFDAILKPRALAETDADDEHADLWINEGWLRLRPFDGFSMQAGREALLWGPAMFWNPSNPFFPQNNRANPHLELAGKDFVRARWQWSPAWALSIISQVGRGHDNSGAARLDAVKLDWVGENASAAALATIDPDGVVGWNGWTQWTATDALLLYGEMAWGPHTAVTLPEPAASPTGWQLKRQTEDSRTLKLLVGGAYTFANSWTLNAELWHNGDGLSQADARQIGQSAAALRLQPGGLANAQLGELLHTTATPYRRDYAGLQLMNGSAAKTSWMLRYTWNLDDKSGEALALLTHDFGDQVQVWADVIFRHGARDSEYGRWIRASSMLGVTWFAW